MIRSFGSNIYLPPFVLRIQTTQINDSFSAKPLLLLFCCLLFESVKQKDSNKLFQTKAAQSMIAIVLLFVV